MKKIGLLTAMVSLASLCWAGLARRNAVDRLNNAAKVLHEIMDAPDQRIPDEILKQAKCVAVIPHLVKRGIHLRSGARQGRGHMPDGGGLECAGVHKDDRRKLGNADRCRGGGPGDGHQERKRHAEAALEQI